MSTKRKILLIFIPLFLVLTIGFGFAGTVKAVEFDEDGIIEEGEIIDDDLFIGADTVEINGTVNGDVFAGGNIVIVNGTINGSLATGAQTILVNGKVSGSIYAGSMTITLGPETEIGRNMFYGGFNLSAEEGSVIHRDLLVGAYQALLSGDIGRDVHASVGALEINGSVGNNVRAEVGSSSDGQPPQIYPSPPGIDTLVPSGIRISDEAEIGGSLYYKSSEDQSRTIAITPPGGIEFDYDPQVAPNTDSPDPEEVRSRLVGAWLIKQVRVFITLMLLGGLIVWQLPGLLNKVGGKVEKEVMPSLGWGLVSIMVVYLGAFLVGGLILAGAIFFGVVTLGELSKVILTVGFSSLALIMAGFGLLVSYGSKLVVSYLVGKLLFKWLAPNYADQPIWPMLVGIFLYTFLRAIPFIGLVIGVTATLIGIGAMWLTYRDQGELGAVEAQAASPEQ
ncbi:MAG TPA: polymer-forming cytoskeletal protein [Chloroflexi bacterium]|nr:polymer-forming cytoskeletal protein [Chloroflexota bacterium]